MAHYVKLSSDLLDSTVWLESESVRLVWIALLLMADQAGYVHASVPGLANRARVARDDCEHALAILADADGDSRTPDNDGRRIATVDGGWLLLNYARFREMRAGENARERKREWDREHRPSGHARRSPTPVRSGPPQSDSPTTVRQQSDASPMGPTEVLGRGRSKEAKAKAKAPPRASRGSPLPSGWHPSPEDWAKAVTVLGSKAAANVELSMLRNWAQSNSATKVDWNATWRNWCMRVAKDNAKHATRAGTLPAPRMSLADRALAHAAARDAERQPRSVGAVLASFDPDAPDLWDGSAPP